MQKAPFAIKANEKTTHYFDARFLALFLLSTANFINPVNRQPMTHKDCLALDQHMRENFPAEQTASVTAAFLRFKHRRKGGDDIQRHAAVALEQLFRSSSARKIDPKEFSTTIKQLHDESYAEIEVTLRNDCQKRSTLKDVDLEAYTPVQGLQQLAIALIKLNRKQTSSNEAFPINDPAFEICKGVRISRQGSTCIDVTNKLFLTNNIDAQPVDTLGQTKDPTQGISQWGKKSTAWPIEKLGDFQQVGALNTILKDIDQEADTSVQLPFTKLALASDCRDHRKQNSSNKEFPTNDSAFVICEGGACKDVTNELSPTKTFDAQPGKTKDPSHARGHLRKKSTTWPIDELADLQHIGKRNSILKRSDSQFVEQDVQFDGRKQEEQLPEIYRSLKQHAFKADAASRDYVQPEPWPDYLGQLKREEMKKHSKTKDATLEEELAALKVIYGEENVSYSQSRDMLGMACWEIHVAVFPIELHVLIPSRCFYPLASPLLAPKHQVSPLSISQTQYLLNKFASMARKHAGTPYLFNLVEAVRSC
jgi:hypothetical protein